MATVTVRTPVAGANDTVGAVRFVDGVAQVDPVAHAAELRYFRSAGYTVEEPDVEPTEEPDVEPVVDDLPKKSASTEVWRAFAASHGMAEEEANAMSRDELAAHYYKEAGQ